MEDAGLAPGATRRQLTVRDVDLEELLGRRFRVGSVECYGVRLCEPCLHLQKLTRPGLPRELVHRAGINADILTTGHITIGDPIVQDKEREQMSSSTPSQPDYTRRLRFDAPRERIFDALTTHDGLAGWRARPATCDGGASMSGTRFPPATRLCRRRGRGPLRAGLVTLAGPLRPSNRRATMRARDRAPARRSQRRRRDG